MFWEIVIGALGGVIGGMGMGGGTLLIPLLTIFLSFSQIQAQGINLIAFLPMSVVALIIHAKNHLVKFKQAIPLAIIGCILSLVGALIANHVSNGVLKKFFALFLIAIGIWQIFEMKKDKNK